MKRPIVIICCFAVLALLASSCYTAHRCPAYGHYSENLQSVEPSVETDGINH